MKLVLLDGSGAVGKMTVGKALSELTGLRLFHNHMMIEPVLSLFDTYDSRTVQALRDVIFRRYVETGNKGLIFTYMCAFDVESDVKYLEEVASIFQKRGGEVYFVELVAPQSVRLKRNRTKERLEEKPSKRDVLTSEARIIREDSLYRLESLPGEVKFQNYLKIDNSHLTPNRCARLIKEHFQL
ncbi:MAG: hypothetical protein KBS81_10125 [Spirochaetales bacterium]|nr:hypothetical protein [Candidatus Physcosoma equi]